MSGPVRNGTYPGGRQTRVRRRRGYEISTDYGGAKVRFSLPSTLVDDDRALAHLPPPYSLALRLETVGADRALIADCLSIEAEAVAPLLVVAHQKLAAIRAEVAQQPEGPRQREETS